MREELSLTKLLKRAFDKASNLPESDQDWLAEWLLDELASNERWRTTLARSSDRLSQLATEALDEHRAARTHELNPDQL
jgi:hypothetical protein